MRKDIKRITLEEDCTGCLACEVACKQEHNLPVGPRWIRVHPDVREVNGELKFNYFVTECHRVSTPPCQAACPAEMNAWKYVILASQGRFEESLEVVREVTPLVGVLGRVCTRPCETDCERGNVDAPVSIRSLKAFLADNEIKSPRKKAAAIKPAKSDKVAVIGSGPAGLSCAYSLVRQGYPVTIFEAKPEAGGLMRYGIPDFRLPREVVENEINYVKELGVDIKTNSPVKDPKSLLTQGYKAVFLGIGAGTSQKAGIPGEDTEGVIHALDLLEQVKLKPDMKIGNRVAVIGGGNAAVDTARVALKLGAKEVSLIYRRSRAEMPAMKTEVDEAESEGAKINFLTAPVSILAKDGKITGIRCQKMELDGLDASGRKIPVPVNDSEFDIDADNVITAIGQAVDSGSISNELEYTSDGNLAVDPITFRTNLEGIFAGGDVVSGPSDIVGAVAAGNQAAISIDRYLSGVDMLEERTANFRFTNGPVLELNPKSRTVDISDEKVAIAEGKRCLNCGICLAGYEAGKQPACVSTCPAHCLYYEDYYKATPKTGTYTLA